MATMDTGVNISWGAFCLGGRRYPASHSLKLNEIRTVKLITVFQLKTN